MLKSRRINKEAILKDAAAALCSALQGMLEVFADHEEMEEKEDKTMY